MSYEVKIHAPADLSEKWYVYIYSAGKIIKKFYKGLAKEDNYADRMLKAEVLKSFIEREIKAGWKPDASGLPQPENNRYTIAEAYEIAYRSLSSMDRERTTLSQYKTHYNFFIETLKSQKWEDYPISKFETYHISLILDIMQNSRGKSNNFFNHHLKNCKVFFKFLVRKFIIKTDPTEIIEKKKWKTKEKRLLTSEEQTQIINHFKDFLPQFVTYLKVLYHTSVRPKEIRLLKCGMIDTERWIFVLPEEITKNDKKGIIVIPDDLKNDLIKLNLSNPDYYLFGIATPHSTDREKTFVPAPYPLALNTANKLWKQEVKDKLGIDSDMYWLKSKSNNDKMRNGMSLDAVRISNRHSNTEITKIYATEHDIITMQQNIDKFGIFE